jgi:hypothetical protein
MPRSLKCGKPISVVAGSWSLRHLTSLLPALALLLALAARAAGEFVS